MSVIINGSNTPTAGGVTYGDGTQYATTSAGTTGQALLSAGASAPTWGTPASATTATNLAGGGAGQIPYNTGSGTTAFLAAGTTGQALISNGTSAPSWGSAGAMSLVSTLTASSSASLAWTGLTGNRYRLILENILNNGTDLYLQFGYGATPTWITSGYNWLGPYATTSTGTIAKISSAGASGNGFYPKYYNASSGYGMSVVDLTGFTNGIAQSYTCIEQSYTGSYYYTSSSGAIPNANVITAVRLISSSGAIASGSASLYLISQ